MSDEFEGWVVEETDGVVTHVVVHMFAPGQIELRDGERVLIRRDPLSAEDRFKLTAASAC